MIRRPDNPTCHQVFDRIEEMLNAQPDDQHVSRAHALPLWRAIIQKSMDDAFYASNFETWLENGGTVLLRDMLATPFKDAAFSKRQDGPCARGYPWDDAWMAIDSAGMHARRGE
jgi:hypothetical protein